ncbi:MAG: hypothetical protein JWQ88_2443 [Rhodoferax sp.]|nr:hypothetical protein [Rhodoferax sp.]
MLTAEMRTSPQPASTIQIASPSRGTAAPSLWKSSWTTAGVWCLAAGTLAASLVYTGTEEQPLASHREWTTVTALGLGTATAVAAAPPSYSASVGRTACDACGRVEAVTTLPTFKTLADRTAGRTKGRKPLYEVQVRMATGHVRVVHVESAPALGAEVTVENGTLQAANR